MEEGIRASWEACPTGKTIVLYGATAFLMFPLRAMKILQISTVGITAVSALVISFAA
jgi:hypothetical protein